MKKRTKWIVWAASVVLLLIIFSCSGAAFFILRTDVNNGFDQKAAELSALAEELVNENISAGVPNQMLDEIPASCARGFFEDINNNRQGRKVKIEQEFEYDDSRSARSEYRSLVSAFWENGFESRNYRSASPDDFNDDSYFGETLGASVRIDYFESSGGTDTSIPTIRLLLTSSTCFSDFPPDEN